MRPLGRIFDDKTEQYLLVYSALNTAYKISWIEEEAVHGYRIVRILYRHYVANEHYLGDRLYNDIRYGLIDSKNNLVTQYDFFSLSRLEDGRIEAVYPDPRYDGRESYDKTERFKCILSYSGRPLFKYTTTDSNGNKSVKYKELYDEITAVSKCYYGISLFVKDHKIGIVDYNGEIRLDAEYTHIELQKYYNCFKAYKVKYSSLIGPDEIHKNGETYILSKDKSNWPVSFVRLDSKYKVEDYYKEENIYLLKNKQTSLYCLCFNGRWPLKKRSLYYTEEYTWLKKTGSTNNPEESFFIASDSDKKKGIICVHNEKSKVLDIEFLIRKDVIVCPFEYDRILESKTSCITLIKNNQKGLFSLESKTVLLNCLIPDNVSILPLTIGEGYIGCCRRLSEKLSSLTYFFSDMKGHEIITLDNKWIIKSGFKDGFAKIESDKEYATIDTKGNIKITSEKHKNLNTNSHDCNWDNDDYERDNWYAMTDGMYGDYPDEGFDGDYESIGY